MPDPVTATATVAIATPERYAKQLAAHFMRRCQVREGQSLRSRSARRPHIAGGQSAT
jgi:hypothetical protein